MTDERIVNTTKSRTEFDRSKLGDTHYYVTFHCTNCSKSNPFLMLPKGVKRSGVKVDCENCGCEGTL